MTHDEQLVQFDALLDEPFLAFDVHLALLKGAKLWVTSALLTSLFDISLEFDRWIATGEQIVNQAHENVDIIENDLRGIEIS